MVEKLSIFKIGGKVIDDNSELDIFLKDFATVPGKKILVHGGGKWVSEMCERLGIEVKMTNGRRITDEKTLEVVTMILPGLANKKIVATLQKYGCNALGLTGADGNTIKATRRPVKNGIDFGFVGDIEKVNVKNVQEIIKSGFVPIFTAMTHDESGQLLNTNADTIASSLAVGLTQEYNVDLYYCFEKPGVLKDLADEKTLVSHINKGNYTDLQSEGVIHTGMLPKVDNAFNAVSAGVNRVYICHYGDVKNLSEGNEEFGTQISK
jgi:acetylglutamate kinase